MKSWLLSLGSIALGGALLVATGCSKEPEQYTVVFRQDGQADITYTVDEGSDITDLPTPKAVTGYTVVWDRTTLQNITENIIVTAVATANEYTITYAQEDGVTLDAYTQTVVYDANYQLKTPEKDLYEFDGWYNDTTLVAQSGVWKIASDVTLTAHWADNSYTVTFVNLDGTTVAHTLEKGEVLEASQIPAVQAKEGYDTKWSVEDFSNISEDTTVEVVATAKTYTITYALATGETIVGATTQTVVYDASYQLATPDKYLYSFGGWKTADGTPVDQNGVWNIASDVTLTAQWSDNSYTVTFVNLDGTTVARTLEKGEALVASQIPAVQTKEGYDTKWSVEDFSTVSEDTMVEVVATPKTYTVTYSVPTDATLPATSTAVTYKAEYTLATPVRGGYTFTGWKKADGTPVATTGAEWTIASDVTLTAEWVQDVVITFEHLDGTTVDFTLKNGEQFDVNNVPAVQTKEGYDTRWSVEDFSNISENTTVTTIATAKTYTITYVLKSGESIEGETTQTVTFDADYTLKTPTKGEAQFAYWGTADGAWVKQTGKWTIAEDVELHAEWSSDIQITFVYKDTNRAPVVREAMSGTALAPDQIPALDPVEGYDVAWSVTNFSVLLGNMTVEEVWTPKTYTITYSVPEDATLSETSTTVTYDSTDYTLATPTRYGYIFFGWETADGTLVVAGTEWKIASDVTLTAKWQDNYFVVTFVNTDDTSETVMVEIGDTLTEDRVPALKTVTGYTVAWSVEDLSTITSETTVTAVKTPKTYTITYKSAEGVTLPSELTVTYGEEYNLGTPTNSDRGLYFAGWKNAETGEKVKTSGVWKVDDEDLTVTLEAIWIEVDSNDWTGNH